jgi:hypothetical protein
MTAEGFPQSELRVPWTHRYGLGRFTTFGAQAVDSGPSCTRSNGRCRRYRPCFSVPFVQCRRFLYGDHAQGACAIRLRSNRTETCSDRSMVATLASDERWIRDVFQRSFLLWDSPIIALAATQYVYTSSFCGRLCNPLQNSLTGSDFHKLVGMSSTMMTR